MRDALNSTMDQAALDLVQKVHGGIHADYRTPPSYSDEEDDCQDLGEVISLSEEVRGA